MLITIHSVKKTNDALKYKVLALIILKSLADYSIHVSPSIFI